MPIKYFKCPDNNIIECKDCIQKCRMRFRCVPPAVPSYIFNHQRKWEGKLSVTSVLNPTCKNYLTITQDLTVAPLNHVYSMIGTINHKRHEEGGNNAIGIESELFLENDIVYGTTDMLEEIDGKYYLRDVKNKKCSQMYYILDYKQVGDKKYALPSWKQKGTKISEDDDVVFQLNCYRILLEKSRNIHINKMFMDVVLVDWSAFSSPKKYGLKWQYYAVPILKTDDNKIIEKVKQSNERLHMVLKDDSKLLPCYMEEDRWKEFGPPGSFSRCKIYCDCYDACVNYFKQKGIEHKASV